MLCNIQYGLQLPTNIDFSFNLTNTNALFRHETHTYIHKHMQWIQFFLLTSAVYLLLVSQVTKFILYIGYNT